MTIPTSTNLKFNYEKIRNTLQLDSQNRISAPCIQQINKIENILIILKRHISESTSFANIYSKSSPIIQRFSININSFINSLQMAISSNIMEVSKLEGENNAYASKL